MPVEDFGLEGSLLRDKHGAVLDDLLDGGAAIGEVLVQDGGQAGGLQLRLLRGILLLRPVRHAHMPSSGCRCICLDSSHIKIPEIYRTRYKRLGFIP